jgi:acetylornithine deacetylase/succinyl-diaminopimelate desuccinylase-like protein
MEPEQILSELIKLNTSNPPGQEILVARYLKNLFDAAGIPNLIIEPAPGRANFIARLGEGTKKLLFLSHADVVPAGEGWEFDPFSGVIREGYVWGRGAMDCKGLVAAEAWAMLYLAKHCKLNGTLIFAATADEEQGGTYGARYLVTHHLDLVTADFVVNEGGEEPAVINGKPVYFIQVGEKGIAWSLLKAQGTSCHGSVPTLGDNAVLKMAGALQQLARYRPQIRILEEVKQLIAGLTRLTGKEVRAANETELIQGLARLDDHELTELLRAMTRMTISPNVIRGGTKTNIVPDYCEVEIDVRVLPDQDIAYVTQEIQQCLDEPMDFTVTNFQAPSFSPATTVYYRYLADTLRQVAGEVTVLPQLSTGGTDSRYFRGIGIPSYGISLMDRNFDPALRRTVHGRNERIDLPSLSLHAEFLVALAQNYLA